MFFTGFGNDTACFSSWANRVYSVGFSNFYAEDYFSDYPPGYLYILYPIGLLVSVFQITSYSPLHLLLLKTPAIVCDLILSYIIYKEALPILDEKKAQFLCLCYLFNPAAFFNSAIWGQVDAVFTLAVVVMILSLVHKKPLYAYIAFGAGILLKPQTLVFTPVLMAGILDQIILHDFSVKNFFKNLGQGLIVILCMVLLALPFGLDNVISQYTDTLSSYAYAAVNAFNFWGWFGLNWISISNKFLGITYQTWGMVFIVLAVLVMLYLSISKPKEDTKYPLLGAFLILTVFTFSTKMHERYMYPGLILLLLAYLFKPTKELLVSYLLFTFFHLYNTAYIYFYYDPYNYNRTSGIILFGSAGILCSLAYFYLYALRQNATRLRITKTVDGINIRLERRESASVSPAAGGTKPAPAKEGANSANKATAFSFKDLTPKALTAPKPPKAPGKTAPLKRMDWILMAAVTLIYACVALYDLGDLKAAQTTAEFSAEDEIALTFDREVSSFAYYIAPWHNRNFTLSVNGGTESEITLASVFTWQTIDLPTSGTSVSLTLTDSSATIIELCFYDAEGNVVTPLNASDYEALFDEQDLVPARFSFRNSMYFDEIYHARTAYEMLHGLYSYENTHPPLGKVLISLGVFLFGMTPFGWRIVGTLFGIAMVPFAYLFAKKLTNSTFGAALAAVIYAFDFMHFTQSRIATIDVYITFFVILMYYFMYCYLQTDFIHDDKKKRLLPLGACGICMGLGVASKWTGVYAGVGLAVLFFASLLMRYREYLYARQYPNFCTEGIAHRQIVKAFMPRLKETIAFCIKYFVFIPLCIYTLAYIPFRDSAGNGLIGRMLKNIQTMYSYHSNLVATHSFSSPWYAWPTLLRPVWYYSGTFADAESLREGISAFGNPLVWWVGIPVFFYMLYRIARFRDTKAAFLAVSYLAQYLPWFFVTRITFIYHYFPCVIFVVLMIVYSFTLFHEYALQRWPNKPWIGPLAMGLYALGVLGLFVMFYPVLSGQAVDVNYVTTYLRWMDGWILVRS